MANDHGVEPERRKKRDKLQLTLESVFLHRPHKPPWNLPRINYN